MQNLLIEFENLKKRIKTLEKPLTEPMTLNFKSYVKNISDECTEMIDKIKSDYDQYFDRLFNPMFGQKANIEACQKILNYMEKFRANVRTEKIEKMAKPLIDSKDFEHISTIWSVLKVTDSDKAQNTFLISAFLIVAAIDTIEYHLKTLKNNIIGIKKLRFKEKDVTNAVSELTRYIDAIIHGTQLWRIEVDILFE
ncbi:hypothetical protein EUCA11A_18980 [Eubacterium callanderi]|uniref:hypothetical protein n=1 Tax=Eubacterium callanderi TaxID=53442 RepID=UPI0029FF487C|nr:hypothetical protein [Eubacterium callanderi]WPK67726.1 hypothetical protein EUCA2A_18980 [Eubacterium callanderi]WPK72024.1 hypothetical protein EUCA11A_18980 [Eubacterium callanderi]